MAATQEYTGITKGAKWAGFAILILVLLMGAGAVTSSYLELHHYQQLQQQSGRLLEAKLCVTLDKLAAIKPPPGNPSTNPSRSYEMQLSEALGELKPDLGCA